MKNILFVFGTRPEVIKLAPVILELRKYPEQFNVIICNTEQQKQLSNQTLSFFGLEADIKLDVMMPNQTLAGVQSIILEKLSQVYDRFNIDATIIQGDTMSVFCGALCSFYRNIPVFHVEAGLRSFNLREPFPEEAMRQMTSRITDIHFAPTESARHALLKENIVEDKIIVTGNTVIDALYCLSDNVMILAKKSLEDKNIFLNHKLVLITVHRRENHGERLDSILSAIKELAGLYSDHNFVLPVHPNPNVKEKVHHQLKLLSNVIVTEPLEYPQLVLLMKESRLILTDSGGIQEEAPTFGTPLLVMRHETERKEGIDAGFSSLVGTEKENIVQQSCRLLNMDDDVLRIKGKENPYGDGKASIKIKDILLKGIIR